MIASGGKVRRQQEPENRHADVGQNIRCQSIPLMKCSPSVGQGETEAPMEA